MARAGQRTGAGGPKQTAPTGMAVARIGNVGLRVGDAVFMMADEVAEIDVLSPSSRGGTTVSFVIEVPDTQTLKLTVNRLRNIDSVFDAYRVTPGGA